VIIGNTALGGGNPLSLIAGPCVIEDEDTVFYTAQRLKEICADLDIPLIFKSSYDKANRTSLGSFRGPGIDRGLRILSEVKSRFQLPVLSDVHSVDEVKPASEVLDVLQIPAFLCRQTDLILAASRTGRTVNIKKAVPCAVDMKNIIDKCTSTGTEGVCNREDIIRIQQSYC
jgi:2-dehydro-3-deoxyphosphooctonate aldolase (KDO 8-P synthase)